MADEYTADGIVGILLFSLIIGIAVYLFWQEMGLGASFTKQLFLTMLIIMSFMEMPRYYALAVTGSYDYRYASLDDFFHSTDFYETSFTRPYCSTMGLFWRIDLVTLISIFLS